MTPTHRVHEMNQLENIWSMLLDCKCFCLRATFKLWGGWWRTVHLNEWQDSLTLPYFKMTYNTKIARIKDLILSPSHPNKRQSEKLLPFDENRNGHDQWNSYYTIQESRVWPKSVRFWVSDPIEKVGTNLFDAQKGEKGRILNCIGIFKTPRLPWSA